MEIWKSVYSTFPIFAKTTRYQINIHTVDHDWTRVFHTKLSLGFKVEKGKSKWREIYLHFVHNVKSIVCVEFLLSNIFLFAILQIFAKEFQFPNLFSILNFSYFYTNFSLSSNYIFLLSYFTPCYPKPSDLLQFNLLSLFFSSIFPIRPCNLPAI